MGMLILGSGWLGINFFDKETGAGHVSRGSFCLEQTWMIDGRVVAYSSRPIVSNNITSSSGEVLQIDDTGKKGVFSRKVTSISYKIPLKIRRITFITPF